MLDALAGHGAWLSSPAISGRRQFEPAATHPFIRVLFCLTGGRPVCDAALRADNLVPAFRLQLTRPPPACTRPYIGLEN